MTSFIKAFKYNYCFDQIVQNFGSYHAFIEIKEDNFIQITNRKPQEEAKYVDEQDQKKLKEIM